ncbi:TetR/AcrR family transcriptional regulator [Azorhizobium doebereinerae]|uniref:TetR/AcrR family transcriptional regulator n=1 Tax=Azorhizobium doebereinerae TaxID=281091 RepID=UPI00040DA692|nr:TetR/AcrR family transcriptional regulator [Azorhizobium doebereinerae]
MDNNTRSERSRKAILDAALTIIARDGPGRLTLDAIARESGISKGGLMHQFRTKEAVLKALLEHQIAHFDVFSKAYQSGPGAKHPEQVLASQIVTIRETTSDPHSVFFAILGALAQDPGLLSISRERSAERVEGIKAEAADPDLALLRWSAALGLALTTMLGMSPLSPADRDRLFARLLDAEAWTAQGKPSKPRPAARRKQDA